MAGKVPQQAASQRGQQAASRGEPGRSGGRRIRERELETRHEHWLLLGVVGVLALAAVIVAVGVYLAEYRPPRAHVLRVQDTDYDAGQVAGRAVFALRFEPGAADLAKPEQFVGQVLDRIERDHVLRERAPALVGAVSADDIERELRTQLGLLPATPTPAPTAPPVATATATSTATAAAASATPAAGATASATTTATASPTPLPAMTDDEREAYATGLRDILRSAGLSRAEYEAVLTASLLQRRLAERYEAEVGTSGAQLQLARIRVADEATANRVREQVLGGADFAKLAAEQSLDQPTRATGGDLGWRPAELLEEDVRDAVANLGAGSVAIVRSGRLFDVYRVTNADAARAYDAGVAAQLAQRKVDDWVTAEKGQLRIERDLSSGEETWIREQVGERLQRQVS